MASLFKRGDKWVISLKDRKGRWVQRVGYTNKEATKRYAQQLQAEEDRIRAGGQVDPHLAAKNEPLDAHIDAYQRFLESKGRSKKHTDQTISRLRVALAPFQSIDELATYDAPDKILRVLAKLERPGQNTRGYYLAAAKAFARWAEENNRLAPTRISKQSIDKQPADRHRRAATDDEFAALIDAATSGPTVRNLTGEQRAMLYLVAAYSGLRAQELASMTAASIREDCVVVPGKFTKNGQPATQPLRADVAAMLQPWLEKQSGLLWPGSWWNKAAEMMRHDQNTAGIAYETDEGVFDFHALRVTYVTNLARAGVHPKIAQQLARHSTVNLTLAIYTRFADAETRAAVERMAAPPQLSRKPR